MFDVRIVNVDHYMAAPLRGFDPAYSDFRGTSISQVPVIRVFGSTASGKKTCLHIHGVFPYIYVPYDGESDSGQQIYQLAASLDKALNIALGTANSVRQHIYKVVHVKGVPFYGYHEKSHQFLKIYFYNPLIVKKATDLLQNGAVCNKIFQCHEAHLPFILQFFIDYNLHGMSFIELSSVQFREDPGTISCSDSESKPSKVTYCEIEADGNAIDILNRNSVGEVANPGLAGIWSEERLRNDVSQLSQNQSQERFGAKCTLSEVLLRQRLKEALEQLSGRITGNVSNTSLIVYPAESIPGEEILDASIVEGSCTNSTAQAPSLLAANLQMDDSIIDEQLVLSLSQAPGNSQDQSLLDIMQSLAERGAEGEEMEVSSSQPLSAEILLSQPFHCFNMEEDSVLGVPPNAAAEEEEEGPPPVGHEETVEKEDCWQDSFWNGLDSRNIPQLDGANDDCNQTLENSNKSLTLNRLCRIRNLCKKNQEKVNRMPVESRPPASPITTIVDSSVDDNDEEESYNNVGCYSENIFNQERFWCKKSELDDSDLNTIMLTDTVASSINSEMFDGAAEEFTDDDKSNPVSMNECLENVLMHGDPSLTSLVEGSSEDNYANLNGTHSVFNVFDSTDNFKGKVNLEESGQMKSNQESGLEFNNSADIVNGSEFLLNFDYEYSSFEDQVFQEENGTSDLVKKQRKNTKTENVGKVSKVKGQNRVRESKNVSCNGVGEFGINEETERLDMELNNNEKKKQLCKVVNKEGEKRIEGMAREDDVTDLEEKDDDFQFVYKKRRIVDLIRQHETSIQEVEVGFKENDQFVPSSDANPIEKTGPESSTSPNKENLSDDSLQIVQCYCMKQNGGILKMCFPLKRQLSTKAKRLINERRKKFASVLFPKIDPRIRLCAYEDNQLTSQMIDSYHGIRKSAEFEKGMKSPSSNRKLATKKNCKKTKSLNLEQTNKSGFKSPRKNGETLNGSPKSPNQKTSPIKKPSPKNTSSRDCLKKGTKNPVSLRKRLITDFEDGDSSQIVSRNIEEEFVTKNCNPLEMYFQSVEEDMLKTSGVEMKSSPKKSPFGPKTMPIGSTEVINSTLKSPYRSKKQIATSPLKKHHPGSLDERLVMGSGKKKKKNVQTSKKFNPIEFLCLYSINPCCVVIERDEKLDRFADAVCKVMKKQVSKKREHQKLLETSPNKDTYPNVKIRKHSSNIEQSKLKEFNSKSLIPKVKISRLSIDENPGPSGCTEFNSKSLIPKVKLSRLSIDENPGPSGCTEFNSKSLIPKVKLSRLSIDENPGPSGCTDVESHKADDIVDGFKVPSIKMDSEMKVKIILEESILETSNTNRCIDGDLSMSVRSSHLDYKCSVKLDRIDESIFHSKKPKFFNIDCVDGSFPEDIESSSDEEVNKKTCLSPKEAVTRRKTPGSDRGSDQGTSTPRSEQRKNIPKSDQQKSISRSDQRKRASRSDQCRSTPRPRYKPLRVKITKSPPKKDLSKQCWVVMKKFVTSTNDGSSSDHAVSRDPACSSNSMDPKKLDDDASSSHSALSGSEDSDMFGESLFQGALKRKAKIDEKEDTERGDKIWKGKMSREKESSIAIEKYMPLDSPNNGSSSDAFDMYEASLRRESVEIHSLKTSEINYSTDDHLSARKLGDTDDRKISFCMKDSSQEVDEINSPHYFEESEKHYFADEENLSSKTLEDTDCKNETLVLNNSFTRELHKNSNPNSLDGSEKFCDNDGANNSSKNSSLEKSKEIDCKKEKLPSKNPIYLPGPSTSTAQPWCNANVYDSSSSYDEKEDNGVLSFYDTSVYMPGTDSDSEKTIYEILSSDVEESSEHSDEEKEKVYIPEIRPPSPKEVLASLPKYSLPKIINLEPFCSDLADRTSTEIGPVSLKLKSRSIVDLEEYEGPFSKGLCMYRNKLMRELEVKTSMALASEREVVLVPLNLPPSSNEVKKWLKVKSEMEIDAKRTENEKIEKLNRIVMPFSPGQAYTDDEQNTLILTPMTTPCRSHSTPSVDPPTGFVSATATPAFTPVLCESKSTKRKSENVLKKKSSKLLKGFAAMSFIQESAADDKVCEENDSSLSQNLQQSDSSICISDETREKMELQLKRRNRLSSSFQIEACNSDSGIPNHVDNMQKTRPQAQHQFLTLMVLELHLQTRGDLLPDPEYDPIRAIFYNVINDVPEESEQPTTLTGIITVGHLVHGDEKVLVTCVPDEMSLILALVELVRKWDPDMFIGYEIEKFSWGYLIERAYTLGVNLNVELSRVMGVEGGSSKYEDEQGMLGGDGEQLDIRLAGRIVLNVWRLLRHEVALQSYTFESIMYHVLRRRIPLFSYRSLSAWWEHKTQLYRWMAVEHYLVRVRGIAEILDHLDLVGRTSELARLFGIQFYEVLSRGSQFRVESMMLRMAKPENYVAVSPSTKQRAHMRAPESLPLIMEPESRFYSDPVIVLDFQSLYPSIIIAYNYCFSTCLGRVENLAKSELFDFGCTHLRVPFTTVKKLEENLTFSPCGVAFVKSSVREGILPRMLQEILETRLMVKKSMKKNKDNKALHRVLHNRQLGLKLIANVTYGYTSANFSGRMPCIEIGDSVVSKGRETLERAIALVTKTEKWGARVVYGDTDSLFVLVPGRSRSEAFQIGSEIAEAVTAENPKPVKLKLEKVYQPCILQTKKRYVGHMWESPDQVTPTYDAKGIETVRRDGCPAVAKILQKSLQLLFETKDVSIVKRFILHQFGKVSSGRISIQELTFAREYRGARGYKPGACVPALELARSWMKKDRRSEPRVGERVPYVIVSGPPGLPLIRLVRSPRIVLADPTLKINADYYITRVIIPPLNRCLQLVGANAQNWFNSMPRRQPPSLPSAIPSGIKKATISQYFATVSCAVCHEQTTTGLCSNCRARPQIVAVSLASQLHSWERRHHLVSKVCQSCCGRSNNIDCVSLDCPVLYARADAKRDLRHEPVFRQLQNDYFNCDF